MTERARVTKDPDALLEAARGALGPAITALYAKDGTLFVITIDAVDERMLSMRSRRASSVSSS